MYNKNTNQINWKVAEKDKSYAICSFSLKS